MASASKTASGLLAALPGCGRRATFRIEGYARTATGGGWGSLDFDGYVCAGHLAAAEEAIRAAGYTPHRLPPGTVQYCGRAFDFTTMTSRPAPQREHPDWCDAPRCTGRHRSPATSLDTADMAVRAWLAQPRRPADGPPVVVVEQNRDNGEPVMVTLPLVTAAGLADVLARLADDGAV